MKSGEAGTRAAPARAPGGVRRAHCLAASLLATLLALPAGGARAADCLRFEPDDVTLAGTLRLEVFPGPPHYRSFETGDQPESIWMLTLAEPACIDPIAGDADNAAATRVTVVQVVPRAPFSVNYNSRRAHVQGTLYRPHGGHPHAPVLLRATSVTPDSR